MDEGKKTNSLIGLVFFTSMFLLSFFIMMMNSSRSDRMFSLVLMIITLILASYYFVKWSRYNNESERTPNIIKESLINEAGMNLEFKEAQSYMIHCPNCGAPLKIDRGKENICEYCKAYTIK